MQHVIYQLIPINPHHSPQTIETLLFLLYVQSGSRSLILVLYKRKRKKINTFISFILLFFALSFYSFSPSRLSSMCRLTHSLVFFEGRSRRYLGFYGLFLTLKENQLLSVTGMSMAAAVRCVFFFAQRCSRGAWILSSPCLESTMWRKGKANN